MSRHHALFRAVVIAIGQSRLFLGRSQPSDNVRNMFRRRDLLLIALLSGVAAAEGIQGRVREDHSGSQVASAEVRVRRIGSARLIADIETDAAGQFRLPQLPPGDYTFEFIKANYIPTTLRFKEMVPAEVSARLVRCGSILGRVLDADGKPVRGAVVYAMPKPAGGAPLRPLDALPPGSYSQVDRNGEYRLYYLAPGEYAVAASYGASSMVLGGSGSAPVASGVGSGVAVYPDSARPQFLTIAGGEEHRNVNLNLPPSSSFTVSGKVEMPAGSGSPPAGRFWLTLVSGQQPSLATAATIADEHGAFRFEGVAAGSYHLLASGPSSARSSRGAVLPSEPWFARSRLEVIASSVEGIVLTPQRGATVSFLMRASAETNASCPPTAQLTLVSLEDWSSQLERTVSVNNAKAQSLTNLAPSRYAARVEDLGDLCYQESDVTLDIAATRSDTVVVPVSAGGAIRGKLVGTARVSDFAVALLSANTAVGDRPVRAAVPDANGGFTFDGLRPGSYYISARPAAAQKGRWISDPARMMRVEIRGGSYTDLELPAVGQGEGDRE